MLRRFEVLSLCMMALCAIAAFPHDLSADPAVSAMNGKISGFGGGLGREGDESGLAGLEGSLTAPIGQWLGLQVDGAYASVDGDDFAGTGAHLFWRDPAIGLLGLYAGYAHLGRDGGQDVARAGAEAQAFLGQLTIDAAVGARFVDLDDVYGRLRLQFYPLEDLMLSAGFVYEGESFGEVAAQYQLAPGIALYGEGRAGDDETYLALGGLRIFLGEEMSLIDRHRRQDPEGYTSYDLTATRQAVRRNQSTMPTESGGGNVCPFTPDPDLCTRLSQCAAEGYTDASPGAASCECLPAFDNAPFC